LTIIMPLSLKGFAFFSLSLREREGERDFK
jgi:hypothetical protein